VEQFFSGFRAFPLPSHIRKKLKWQQLRIATIACAFERALDSLLDDPDDAESMTKVGCLALSLGKFFGLHTFKFLRLASILLQMAKNEGGEN